MHVITGLILLALIALLSLPYLLYWLLWLATGSWSTSQTEGAVGEHARSLASRADLGL
jgi:hypothetical protein